MDKLGHFRPYIDIPGPPTQLGPIITIVPGDIHVPSQSFLNNLHGMVPHVGYDIKTSGDFGSSAFKLNDYTAIPPVRPYIIVTSAGDIFGSATSTNHAIDQVTDGDGIQLYGGSITSPPILRSQTQNGMQLSDRIGGTHYIVQNFVADSPGASGFTCNFGVGGGRTYASIDLSFFRAFNTGQEGICYIGHTFPAPYDDVNFATVHDCLSYNSSREGTQTEHVDDLRLYNNTVILSGQTGGGGQDGLIQVQDSLGYVINSIYDGAPNMGTLFTHGFTFKNNYFRWTTANPYFIGRTDGNISVNFSQSSRLNNKKVLFDSCYFHCDAGALSFFCTVEERFADIEFRNCVFSPNIGAIFNDNRVAGYINKLIGTIGTNGNISATITPPTYVTGYNLYNNYLNHGLLVVGDQYYALGMGYRTPGPRPGILI